MSNSYAAPYITSLVGALLVQGGIHTVFEIKKKLLLNHSRIKRNMLCFAYSPDWITSAWMEESSSGSSADFYFSLQNDTYEEAVEKMYSE